GSGVPRRSGGRAGLPPGVLRLRRADRRGEGGAARDSGANRAPVGPRPLAEARSARGAVAPEDADELLLVGSFLRRPPPELEVVRLDDLDRGYLSGDEGPTHGSGDPA